VTSVVLLLASTVWLARGSKHLITGSSNPDLYSRWRELRYLYNGQNPNDLGEAAAAEYFSRALPEPQGTRFLRAATARYFGQPLPECSRNCRIDPGIGPLYFWEGTYPGWSYFTAAAFVPPTNWQVTCICFAAFDFLALAAVAIWAYRLGRPHSVAGGVFLAASALGMYGNYSALDRGQFSLIVNGLLIGVYFLMERSRPTAAGIAYGMALIKPHISALFAIVFLVRKQWRMLAAAAAYVVVASLCIWALSKTNPMEMLKQSLDAGMLRGNDGGQSSLLSLLIDLDVDRTVATPLVAISGLIATAAIAWLSRSGAMTVLYAAAATIGRLWTYHHGYDNVMLVFLIVALGEALLTRYSNWLAFAFCVVAVSLWSPLHYVPPTYFLAVQIAQIMSWLLGLVVLLASDPRHYRLEGGMAGAR